MRFEFATAARIVFGAGTLPEAARVAHELGRRAIVVTGGNAGRAARLLEMLTHGGIESSTFAIQNEPSVDAVVEGARSAREQGAELIIGFGGGSALDAAKAIAVFATNTADPFDHLEVVGRGLPLGIPPLPCIAIPTTAGTGSEVTRNAVLASPKHCVKVSLRSPLLLPRLALVDPELTLDLPPAITASTGLDALTQLIEPFLCTKANPMTDALCVEGMRRVARSLRVAADDGRNLAAREDMALASLFGGLALANAGLGAVHGFAGPIGGMFPAPHGAVCAALLPHVMDTNLRALRERGSSSPALVRFNEVARLLCGRPTAVAQDGVAWLADLVSALQIPRLNSYSITADDLAAIVEKASQSSSMKANPIVLTAEELTETLLRAL